MDRLLENDTILKILSVLVAIFVWAQVNGSVAQTVERRLGPVPLAWTLPPGSGLTVLSLKPNNVTVEIQGPTSDTGGNASAYAWVNLKKLTRPGKYSLPVLASVPTGTKLVAVTPNHVLVTVDRLANRRMTAKLVQVGEPITGYAVTGFSVPNRTVTLAGPSDYLDQVTQVVGKVDVSGQKSGFAEQVLLVPENSRGQAIATQANNRIEVSPQVLTVQVGVSPVKSLPVVVNYSGQPASGYVIRSISVSPNTITVYGPEAALKALSNVTTAPVSISGASQTISEAVKLALPSGVSVLGAGTVQVTIVIGP